MNSWQSEVREVLTNLENAVARDVALRIQQNRSGRSPKSIHREALNKITELTLGVVGEDEVAPNSPSPKSDVDLVRIVAVDINATNRLKASLREAIAGGGR